MRSSMLLRVAYDVFSGVGKVKNCSVILVSRWIIDEMCCPSDEQVVRYVNDG